MQGFLAGTMSGCAVHQPVRQGYYTLKYKVQGAHYLDGERYEEGIHAFEKALTENPGNAEVHYYLGRCRMGAGHKALALNHLKTAVALDPTEADYHYWLGVSFHENGEIGSEQACYERALEYNQEHVPALTSLGHIHLEDKNLQQALDIYQRVIDLQSDSASVLYNRALILHRLDRTPEARLAWKAYLANYCDGPLAKKATSNLNALGDFEYRNHVIGKRTITLRKIWFEISSDRIWEGSMPSLDRLGDIFRPSKNLTLHIVAYQKQNKPLAEARAKSIKQYLLNRFPDLESHRLRVSWFGVPECIPVASSEFLEDASIQFFTTTEETRVEKEKGPGGINHSGASWSWTSCFGSLLFTIPFCRISRCRAEGI